MEKKRCIAALAVMVMLAAAAVSGFAQSTAGYWVDGKWVRDFGIFTGEINLAVDGGKVYAVLGYGPPREITYYVDGKEIKLGQTESGNARSIAVSGGKVYVAGYYYVNYQDPDGPWMGTYDAINAFYWTDGKLTDLGEGAAYSITVADGKVYVAGAYGEEQNRKACYWVDGKRVDLGQAGIAHFITVSGGKVYVAGSSRDYLYGEGFSCYWVDGKRVEFGQGPVKSIAVEGGKVYLAGSHKVGNRTRAGYWVDGKLIDLGEGDAYSITVSGGKVYVAGGSTGLKPCYWVDGKRTDLAFKGGNPSGTAYFIVVSGGKIYVGGEEAH